MKLFMVLAVVGVALAAPRSIIRYKKSAYGPPCGLAAPAGAPVFLSPAPHGIPLAYRENEHLTNGHLEQARHARAYYDGQVSLASPALQIAGPAPSIALAPAPAPAAIKLTAPQSIGPAVGVFPSAKIGGCAIPLLLSCAPSVTSGQLVQSAPSYSSAYRADPETEGHKMRETPDKTWGHEAHAHAKAADFLDMKEQHQINVKN